MATMWMDCFEDYALSTASMLEGLYDYVGTTWVLSTDNPATGSHSLRFNANSAAANGGQNGTDSAGNIRRSFLAPVRTVGVAYRWYCPQQPTTSDYTSGGGPTGMMLCDLVDAGNLCQVAFVQNTDGSISCYRNRRTTAVPVLLGTSAPCITPGAYNHLEFKAFCDDSTGYVEARVNGVTVLSVTGADTKAHASNDTFAGVVIGNAGANCGIGICYLDDFHAWDTAAGEGLTDFGGNLAVFKTPLVSDVSITDWDVVGDTIGAEALSDGSDSTYIGSDTVGARYIGRAEALPGQVTSIRCKQIMYRARKDSSGDCSLTPALRNGSAETPIAQAALGTSSIWRVGQVGLNPTTGLPWAPGDVTDLVIERTL